MEPFKIRTYGRTELAQLYCPGLCPQAAFRKLNQWIDFHPTLRSELHALVSLGQGADIYSCTGATHLQCTGRTILNGGSGVLKFYFRIVE